MNGYDDDELIPEGYAGSELGMGSAVSARAHRYPIQLQHI